jgi:hypothetical protein
MIGMYKLNVYGKIIINETEVYYGCVEQFDEKIGIAKLLVTDWRDRFKEPKSYYEIATPLKNFIIKYNMEMEQ